jgi:hypothetical protein
VRNLQELKAVAAVAYLDEKIDKKEKLPQQVIYRLQRKGRLSQKVISRLQRQDKLP